MIAQTPPAAVAAAPAFAPLTLEAAFVMARASARRIADPESVLAGPATANDKLAAIDFLHSRIPAAKRADKIAAFDALAGAAAAAGRQPPEVRSKALTFLGYAMPQVDDDDARARGLKVLLDALKDPAYWIAALRGLGPASHGLPRDDEASFQRALLDLLDAQIAGEARVTALVALQSFVSARDDLAQRSPVLVADLDNRLLKPIESDPLAHFIADPRFTPDARALLIATVWLSARQRRSLGKPAPAARVHALFARLAEKETDPRVLREIAYRDPAALPRSPAIRGRN